MVHDAYIIFLKDVQLEFRSRFAINAIFLFAVTTLTAISFSIGPIQLRSEILSALLWIILFFSCMSGLSHIFVREEEQMTADTLRLVTTPNAVFLGKWLFNVMLLLGLELVIIPVFIAMLGVHVGNPGVLLLVILTGSLGLATVATLIAAIISQASAKGALFAVLSFPVCLPVLMSGIHGTRLAMDGETLSGTLPDFQILISFSVVILTISLLLFEFIWRK